MTKDVGFLTRGSGIDSWCAVSVLGTLVLFHGLTTIHERTKERTNKRSNERMNEVTNVHKHSHVCVCYFNVYVHPTHDTN